LPHNLSLFPLAHFEGRKNNIFNSRLPLSSLPTKYYLFPFAPFKDYYQVGLYIHLPPSNVSRYQICIYSHLPPRSVAAKLVFNPFELVSGVGVGTNLVAFTTLVELLPNKETE
jgi:hypothetical protein